MLTVFHLLLIIIYYNDLKNVARLQFSSSNGEKYFYSNADYSVWNFKNFWIIVLALGSSMLTT
jgi:hypothetical protein